MEKQPGQLTAGATCKQPHHIAIHNSIGNIHSIVRQLRILKNKLNNDSQPECGEDVVKAPEPSFMEVLNHTPDNIIAECNEAHQILAEIEDMLF